MYSFSSHVRYSEMDYEGKLSLDKILDYFQDCSSLQSEDLGVGIEFLKECDTAWILSSWQVDILSYPTHNEKVRIGTWPHGFKNFFGYRNFIMSDERENITVKANSIWILLNLKSGKPMKINTKMKDAYELEPQLKMNEVSRKIPIPDNCKSYESFPVKKYHIDTNMHVNNAKYVLMAQEYVPTDFKISHMRAEYRKSAVYGDIIYPEVLKEEGKITVVLSDHENSPYAIIELEENE